ncbi:MAG: glycine--tRNA ligase [Candidatus Marinimicrobia bacterium]|nr:glycine--tRNA ligase [Candidatus Neomarinimicrobiota bacterium]MBL7060009.1 glycine--tRNA ligase [Candidatus Neomarinimicrobiota bacterium]
MNLKSIENIVSLSKRRGFIFQSSEIYGGLGSTWDYGPLGVEMKRKIKNHWWHEMVTSRDNIVGMDAAILMHPNVWEASGHVSNFHDPMVDCKNCNARYRADHVNLDKPCTRCGIKDWTEPRQFNLMFKTSIGPVVDSGEIAYLRPETAQGIFVNYANVQTTSRQKLPFGIAQLGKAFRNEITTGNFLFRTREFEQMEMEFFVHPDDTGKWLEYWSNERLNWFKSLGVSEDKLRLRPHGDDELAHYSSACYDIEYEFPFGWSELEGIADRGTFDLDQHNEHSGKKQQYFDPQTNSRYVPAVVEASAGVDRAFLTCLVDAYTEEEVRGEKRTVLKLSPKIAPITCAVFPLVKKDGQPEKAQKIVKDIRKEFSAFFDMGGSIGKRYRRQDEAGTPFGITVDHDTMEDDTVTLRNRDTMEQIRIPAESVVRALRDKIESLTER